MSFVWYFGRLWRVGIGDLLSDVRPLFFLRATLRATTTSLFFRRRAGDSKLKGFVGLTEILNTTSVGVLQEQCLKRNLKVRKRKRGARCWTITHATFKVGATPASF